MGMPIRPFEATSSSMICSQSTTTCLRVAGGPRISLSVLMRSTLPRDRPFVVPMQVVTTGSRTSLPQRPASTLAVLTGVNALNYLDRFITAPVLPLIIASLHLSDAQAGSLQTVFILVYALACPFVRLAR